ncbi:MAG: hypothetical protein WDO73_12790 [Ignavibacteriota bacterium]
MTRSTVASLLCGVLFSIPAVPQQTQPTGSQPPAPQAKIAPQKTEGAQSAQPPAPSAKAAPQQPEGGQATQPPTSPAKTDAQAQPGQLPPQLFKGGTQEIIVPVTVTDDKGRYLANLEEKDFRIMDEGRIQKTTFFYHDSPGIRQHTVIGFLVDLSSSNRSHWDKFQDATKE